MTEDEAIRAAHPTRTGHHDLYAEAMRLVGKRHAKAELVDLVNWLLFERDRYKRISESLARSVKFAIEQAAENADLDDV